MPIENKFPSISVFFPCYNDEKTIGGLVTKAFDILEKYAKDYEVIVVEDGSSDESREVLKALTKKYSKLRLVFHKKNMGYGGALRSGFKAAKGTLVFYTDGDAQYDVGELPLLLMLMTKDVDFVNGIKMERHDYGYRVVAGNLYNLVVRWLFFLPVFDTDCDFRLIRRSVLKRIKLVHNSGAICVELVKKSQLAGARFRQVSIHHYERPHGSSQFFRLDRIVPTFKDVARLWIELMFKRKAKDGQD